jgi:hypothetical protein
MRSSPAGRWNRSSRREPRHKASAALTTVEHSMRLEDQQLLPDAAREMLDEHEVWASRSLVAASSRPSSDD